jgi:creatinine amidohydrolase
MEDRPVSNNIFDLAYPDIQWFLERTDMVLVPVGSCEQHGAHLPVSCDSITAIEVTRRASAVAGVPHTPIVWTGYSPHHIREPGRGMGTITLRPSTFENLLYDIGRSLIHMGFDKIIFVDGHGSNLKVMDPLMRRLRYDTGAFVTIYKPFAERYLGLLEGVLENPPEETPGWHCSELETSQCLAHDERLVRMERAVVQKTKAPDWLPEAFSKQDGAADVTFKGYRYFLMPMEHQEYTPTGVVGNPFRASAEKGHRAFEIFANHLVEAMEEFRKVKVEIRLREFDNRAG